MMIPLFLSLLVAPAPGGVVVFRDQGATGNIVVVDPTGVTPNEHPALLQGIQLLPIEANGRTALERFLPDRTRLIEDIPGAGRLLLPQSNGSLYRFARPEALGSSFGFLLVDALGDARIVFERPGSGQGGDLDPFVARVAVAPDGASFLAATVKSAGGNVFEVDLATGTAVERTNALPPLTFRETGLALHTAWGVAVSSRGVWRFDRAGAGELEFVPFTGGLPDYFGGDVVLSRNGLHAATIAGNAPTSAHVWSFTTTGSASCESATPTTLSGAGFLPDATDGPYLAVSDDGTHCAWRVEGVTREAFLARTPEALAPVQVTADAHYTDTLDEIGQFLFIPFTNSLVIAVGERSLTGPPFLEGVDYYEVTLSELGAPTFTNLTQTSGDLVAPFLSPSTLDPLDIFMHPTADRVMVHNGLSGGTGELLLFEPGTQGLTTVLSDVKALDFAELIASDLVFSVRRGALATREMWRLSPLWTGVPVQVMSKPEDQTFERPAVRPDGWLGFVRKTPTAEFVHLYESASGQVSRLTGRPLLYGPNLSFSPDGDLVLNVGQTPSPSVYVRWTPAGLPARLPVLSSPGFVLPGR